MEDDYDEKGVKALSENRRGEGVMSRGRVDEKLYNAFKRKYAASSRRKGISILYKNKTSS